jgi:transposase
VAARRPDQRRTLPGLRRAGPRPDAQARRHRGHGNLGSHKGKAVRRAIRDAGAKLFFLPKYSPDLNPIEKAFAKLKHWLRKAAARTVDALCDAIGEILDAFEPQECANYFKEAGYGLT